MMKPPSGPGRTNTSGTMGCTSVEPKARPGLGLSLRTSAIMSAKSSSPTPQMRRKVALGQQIEMGNERLHRGIEAIALPELDGEAFREIARTHARRIETLQDRQHGIDLGSRRAQLLGDEREIAVEVAGLVDEIDEI